MAIIIYLYQGCAMGWDNYRIGRGMVPSHEIGWDGTGFSKISSHVLSHSYECVHFSHFLSYVAFIFYLHSSVVYGFLVRCNECVQKRQK